MEDIFCSWTRKLNIVKIEFSPSLSTHSKNSHSKSKQEFLINIYKMYTKMKRTQNWKWGYSSVGKVCLACTRSWIQSAAPPPKSKKLKQKIRTNKIGINLKLTLPDFKTYFKAIVIKIAWYYYQDRQT